MNEPVTLREIDIRFADLYKYMAASAEATKIALDKAATDLDVRLEHMNEFRAQIDKERGSYAQKSDLDVAISDLRADMWKLVSMGFAGGVAIGAAGLKLLAGG